MSRLAPAIIISLLIVILGVIASFISIKYGLEEKIDLNLLFRLRDESKPPSDVIIVSLDKDSAVNLDLPSDPEEWPRSLHARLTEILKKQGAAVIAFDMLFIAPSDMEENDNSFAQAISNAGNVVLCEYLEPETKTLTDKEEMHVERITPPSPLLARAALALAPFPLHKVPEKKRWYWLIKKEAGDIPTLPVVTFQIFAFEVYDEFIQLLKKLNTTQDEKLFLGKTAIKSDKRVEKQLMTLRDYFSKNPELGKKIKEEVYDPSYLSSDPRKKLILKSLLEMYMSPNYHYLNFYGPPGTIETISYYKILSADEESVVDLKGKAVLVGSSDNLRPELQIDGFDTVYPGPNGLKMSGVEIAATAFANLLENKPVQPVVFPVYYATIFLWAVLLAILCLFTRPAIGAVSLVSLCAFYLSVVVFQFGKTGSWFPITVPLFFQAPAAYFGILLWKFFKVNKEDQNIRKVLEGYLLPENIVEQLGKNPGDIKPSTQKVYGTCLYTDGEQYTSLSENMDPNKLGIFMNSYYELISEPVRQYGGIVSDFFGDSMLSIWATPQPDPALRRMACTAALDISNVIKQFKQKSDTLHLPTRIGLHSGFISIGIIKAGDHYEYRAFGDTINTIQRIENANKKLGTRILVSKEMLDQIDGFLTRKVGEFTFKGKSNPVVIYELISRKEESSEQQRDLCAIFSEGLDAYYERSWEKAINTFHESIKAYIQDGPSTYYLKKCNELRDDPPGEDWTGIIDLD